ncbi:hypothetical protein PIB30_030857 [Stylosanthes scabra]|uniref:Zinc knuckle CX2CX4HX4C domain-containing protein n=1 Tax=Stylosanthes scabra TaxID=79078 RepID=A0ABU6VER5_9FABA|nr:hypothetical protein [Stylosanthes scabra]
MEGALRAIWGRLEGFRVTEIGVAPKFGGGIGKVLDVGFFDVKGCESRIIKARVELNDDQLVKDTLKAVGPDKSLMTVVLHYKRLGTICSYCAKMGHDHKGCSIVFIDSKQNQLQEDKIGDWVRAHQVGIRVDVDEQGKSKSGRGFQNSQPSRRKKPLPECLIEGFSNLRFNDKNKITTKVLQIVTGTSMDDKENQGPAT